MNLNSVPPSIQQISVNISSMSKSEEQLTNKNIPAVDISSTGKDECSILNRSIVKKQDITASDFKTKVIDGTYENDVCL